MRFLTFAIIMCYYSFAIFLAFFLGRCILPKLPHQFEVFVSFPSASLAPIVQVVATNLNEKHQSSLLVFLGASDQTASLSNLLERSIHYSVIILVLSTKQLANLEWLKPALELGGQRIIPFIW